MTRTAVGRYPESAPRCGPTRRVLCLAAALAAGACACAVDEAAPPVDAGTGEMPDTGDDPPAGVDLSPRFDGPLYFDLGMPMTEPPLTIPVCAAPSSGEICCPSALGFEDASTMHFLTPTCCQLGLSEPDVVMSPVSCGHGALRLKVDFRSPGTDSMCGGVDEVEACAFETGEVSRSVLTPLDLTGLTLTAMAYLEGPSLPALPALARLFVVARGGVIEGAEVPLDRLAAWVPLGLPFQGLVDGSAADVRVIGLRLRFADQTWAGRMYLDDITWR